MRNNQTVVDQANQFFDQQIKPALADIYIQNANCFLMHLMERKTMLINELADVVVAIALAEIEIRDARKHLEGK